MRRTAAASIAAAWISVAACSSDESFGGTEGASGAGNPACTPGDIGVRQCGPDGTYGECTGCKGTGGSTGAGGAPPKGGAAGTGGSSGQSGNAGSTAGGAAGGAGAAGTGGSGGAPCPSPCGANCCPTGSVCVDSGGGNLTCALSCAANTECPTEAPCCDMAAPGGGACLPKHAYQNCRCNVRTDCDPAQACAPYTNANGDPVGPYVCNGCFGWMVSCGTGYCCFGDAKANEYCAKECTGNSDCGSAHCVQFPDTSGTTCSTDLGCGP
jgi:hypothetical protein